MYAVHSPQTTINQRGKYWNGGPHRMTDATQTHNGLRCSHMIRIDEYGKFML